MFRLIPVRPDPVTLREVLRGVRHVLRSGRRSLRETGAMDSLPGPALRLARMLFDDMDGFARGVDGFASRLAGKVLPQSGSPATPFVEFYGHPEGSVPFAIVAYEALKKSMRYFQADDVFVSEAAARDAFGRLKQAFGDAKIGEDKAAAVLTFSLLDARVVRFGAVSEDTRLRPADIERLAVFSVILWLLAERSDADYDQALLSACELSRALAPQVIQACETRNADALSHLYRRYASNV